MAGLWQACRQGSPGFDMQSHSTCRFQLVQRMSHTVYMIGVEGESL